jgi:hypothetical protein
MRGRIAATPPPPPAAELSAVHTLPEVPRSQRPRNQYTRTNTHTHTQYRQTNTHTHTHTHTYTHLAHAASAHTDPPQKGLQKFQTFRICASGDGGHGQRSAHAASDKPEIHPPSPPAASASQMAAASRKWVSRAGRSAAYAAPSMCPTPLPLLTLRPHRPPQVCQCLSTRTRSVLLCLGSG